MSLENTHILDIDWPAGSENIGGTTQKMWWAPKDDFAVNGLPDVPENPSSLDDAAVINVSNTPFAFKTGKGWNTMYVVRDSGGINCEPQGEIDGKSFMNRYSFIHPGNKKRALGWCRYANNTPMVIIVQEADGTYRMMGSKLFGVSFDTINPTTGVTTAERKQIAVECSFPSKSPAPIIENYIPDNDEVSASTSTSVT